VFLPPACYSLDVENAWITRIAKFANGVNTMKKLTNWIKRHQIAAFYLLAFAISWGLAFSYDAVVNRDQFLLLPMAFMAICGPGLAGIIISTVTNTRPKQGARKAFWIAFLAAWFVSALVFIVNLKFIEQIPLSPAVVGLCTIAVVPVAFVIASAYSRNPSVRSYLASLVRLRGVLGWTLVALLFLPALFLISIPISAFLNHQPNQTYQFPAISPSLFGLVAVKFLYQLFFFNATGEETGWRGFVLPRLQARISPMIAALLIGFLWASWHFLFWRFDGRPVMTMAFWIEMWTAHILASFLLVWMCNRAKGSILVAGIAHAAMNTVQAFAPSGNLLLPILSVAALLVILVDRMWQKLPTDHPAVYQELNSFHLEKENKKKILEVSHV
jgi:membrane protease YdiL (CAAX protease family)